MRNVFASPFLLNGVLLFIAMVWGFGFIPQREGMESMGPAMFNAWRFGIGALTILPIALFLVKKKPSESASTRSILMLGGVLGLLLFAGATFQQISIQYTSLANVAFITSLYVILVPILGFFVGYRYKLIVWCGGCIAIIGFYLMTGSSAELQIKGDMFAFVGAVFWACHLLVLAMKAQEHNQIQLALYQFAVCAISSIAMAFFFESIVIPNQWVTYMWILLSGVLVVGIAYTLQVVVMEHADPFMASMIFATEAIFGAIAGYYMYGELLTQAALVGAGLVLIGCILAQLPNSKREMD